jgi:hypothetical protein
VTLEKPPPEGSVEDLKRGARRFLYPRIAIGVVLLVLMALYIFWPR